MAQTDHVLCVLALAFIAHAGLADHEGLKAFVTQTVQHVDGGDVSVTT